MDSKEPKSAELLKSFTEFCQQYPDMRFFQAFTNWCNLHGGWHYVFLFHGITVNDMDRIHDEYNAVDVFYYEQMPKVKQKNDK